MSKHNAKEWIGILISFQEAGYISMASFIKLSDNVQRNFNVPSSDMVKIINNALETYDKDTSEASVDVKWKIEKPTNEATQWAGIITTMEREKYLSMMGLIILAENIAHKFKLKWNDMAELINYAHQNVDYDKSYAYANVHWK